MSKSVEHRCCQTISNEEIPKGGSAGDQGECSAGRECQTDVEQCGAGVGKEKFARKGKRIQEAYQVSRGYHEVQWMGL